MKKLFNLFKTNKTRKTDYHKPTVYLLDEYGSVKHIREFDTPEQADHYERTLSFTYPLTRIYRAF